MSKKILFTASTLSHISNFHTPYIDEFKRMGWEVHVAVNQDGDIKNVSRVIKLPFAKSFFSLKNVNAVVQAWKLLKQEKYDVVSLHTTLASTIMRLPMLVMRKRPVVFNTVHGYLFNEVMGIKKYAYIIPEKICSYVSDVVMVMNHEDYEICKNRKLYKSKLYYIEGMGVDFKRFKPVSAEERKIKRCEMGFSGDEMLFIYAAEFSKRKNQIEVIKAFSMALKYMKNAYLLLAGEGKFLNECKKFAEQIDISHNVIFLGHVKKISSIYAICDASVSSSTIEGLPFNIMESMGCGIPILASDIKGHKELVLEGINGYLYEPGNINEMRDKFVILYNDKEKRIDMGLKSLEMCSKFSIDKVKYDIMRIYKENMH